MGTDLLGSTWRGTETAALALPPLPSVRPADSVMPATPLPEAPGWSPVSVAFPLFAFVWVCFAVLASTVTAPPAPDIAAFARVLAIGAGVVGLVLITLSVAHTQVSGRRPGKAVVGIVALGLAQGILAQAIGTALGELWGAGAWLFVLIGVAVPLARVGRQFQNGVRRQRVERHASVTASWIARARQQARQTVQSVERHDVRSTLFVIDGAARTLAHGSLSSEQRDSFGEMLTDGLQRLRAQIDVRSEEIEPFAVDRVARAVVHAERKAGRVVTSDLPAALTAVGRAADVAAALRTLIAVTGQKTTAGVEVRGGMIDGAVIVRVEPTGADDLPLLAANWEEIWAETFKPDRIDDDESLDVYVAARLLIEQGGDVWSAAGRTRFAVRLPVLSVTGAQEVA
jgi:hypothetical protein